MLTPPRTVCHTFSMSMSILELESSQVYSDSWELAAVSGISPRNGSSLRMGSDSGNKRDREMFYLTMHSTHFIYGYMVSDIWLRTILIVRKKPRCRHIGYSYRLTARVLLYAPSHRQDNTYHSLCYTSRGALAGTRNIFYFTSERNNLGSESQGEQDVAPW